MKTSVPNVTKFGNIRKEGMGFYVLQINSKNETRGINGNIFYIQGQGLWLYENTSICAIQ